MGISLLLCSPMWSERGNTLHNMFFMVAAVFHNDARFPLVVQKSLALQYDNYEIVVNFFHISHNLT